MDAKEIKRHIDTVENLRDYYHASVGSGHDCEGAVCTECTAVAACDCDCHEQPGTDLEREQALTAALAAMRQVANVQ
jgi:hypothetical protein